MFNILIIEDELAIANLLSVKLQKEGYRCTCAYDGEQGVDKFNLGNYDLIIWILCFHEQMDMKF